MISVWKDADKVDCYGLMEDGSCMRNERDDVSVPGILLKASESKVASPLLSQLDGADRGSRAH